MLKMRRIKIGHLAIMVLVGYLIYVLCFAFLPYFGKKRVSETFAQEVQSYDFYSDSPCVDRVALVEDPSGSLDTRLYLLNQASHTIDIAYYALHKIGRAHV